MLANEAERFPDTSSVAPFIYFFVQSLQKFAVNFETFSGKRDFSTEKRSLFSSRLSVRSH